MQVSDINLLKKLPALNWIILPTLGIWLLIEKGFKSLILFIIVWFIVDYIWTFVFLSLTTNALDKADEDKLDDFIDKYQQIPEPYGTLIGFQYLGTILVPLIIGGLFLGWF